MGGPVLITGAQGFVGRHLSEILGERAVALDADVLVPKAVVSALRAARPEGVVHLAAQSSVAASWQDANEAWTTNVVGTVNVLEAVRSEVATARVVFVSTGEVYGRAEELPTPESAPLAPVSPYAATKAAAEIACGQFARAGLDVVVARAFTHEGPGRDERFAVGSWTRQIARLEEAGGGTLEVGDLSSERDISDVRDVCRAYTLLLDAGTRADTYNVASGRTVTMRQVAEALMSLANAPIELAEDPARFRPADIPVLCGDATKLREATGWAPTLPLERTLADALEHARREVRAGVGA